MWWTGVWLLIYFSSFQKYLMLVIRLFWKNCKGGFGCKICAKVAGDMSSLRDLTCGVSQGSVLCLVFFLISANCMTSSVGCSWKSFADDYRFCFSFPKDTCVSILQGMMQLQNDLNGCALLNSDEFAI